MMKPRDRRFMILTAGILAVALVLTIVGAFMKSQLTRKFSVYEDQWAISIPFMMLHDNTDWRLLHADDEGTPIQPPKTEKPIPTVPTEPSESTEPTEPQAPTETTVSPTTEPQGPKPVFDVDESYFDNALFIGDSRMVGVSQYGRLGNADYFAKVGLTSFNVFSEETSDENFGEMDLSSLLSQRDYDRIYIMLGINEVGYMPVSLEESFHDLVTELQAQEPNAKIYLMKIYGVSPGNINDYLTLDSIAGLNDILAQCAVDTGATLLDCTAVFNDENGYLRDELSGDGLHLYAKDADLLSRWLCENAD